MRNIVHRKRALPLLVQATAREVYDGAVNRDVAKSATLALSWVLLSCGAPRGGESRGPVAASFTRAPLSIEVQGISEAKYNASSLGLAGEHVALKITNPSTANVDMRALRVTFEAMREGVSFPCIEQTAAENREREPKVLRAGESFRYERVIPCTLSLPGSYAVSVYTMIGDSNPRTLAGSFTLNLTGARDNDPRRHPAVSGLYGAVIGNPFSRPMPRNSPAKYTAVVVLVNGSSRAIEHLSASIVFRVYKIGQPLPCMESPVPLHVPERILPGATYTESVPVACVLDALGDYDVVGSLEVGSERKESADLGRYRLTISSDPRLFTPPP